MTIRYNSLNLPDTIRFKNGNAIYYTYNATGMKLRTTHITVKPDLANPITLSVGQVQPLTQSETLSALVTTYMGNHVFEFSELKMTLFPGGYIRRMLDEDNNGVWGCYPIYHYYLKDYLGNNRDVLRLDGGANWTVVQRTEYTPFGVSFPQTVGDAAEQHYKFGGKELDKMHGLNYYDFHAQFYDPLGGTFLTVDPLAAKYPEISPYVYCANNPVRFIDPTGRDIWEINEKGEIVQRIEDTTQDAFYMVNADGERKTDADGNDISIAFEHGTIGGSMSFFGIATGFLAKGESEGAELFRFFADNTKVEFGLINTLNDGSVVMTNHKNDEVKATQTAQIMDANGKTVTSIVHNHLGNATPSQGARNGDTAAAGTLTTSHGHKIVRYVYQSNSNNLVEYNKNGRVGEGTTPWGLVFSPSKSRISTTVKRP